MSLIQRKPRPIRRDDTTLRDDRLFIIACDDTYAPKQYFEFFQIARIQVHVVQTEDGTSAARHVIDRLLEFKRNCEDDDELWMLLDTDHCTKGEHIRNFTDALKKARESGVKVALSKPCFEIWLLLHHVDESLVTDLKNASETEKRLRDTLGEYNKTHLKPEHYPISSVPDACKRAERLDTDVGGGDIPNSNTSRVYLLWKAIVAKALPSQLPRPLASLLP